MDMKVAIENSLRAIAQGQRAAYAWSTDGRCKDCDRRMKAIDLTNGYCPLCVDYVEKWK